MRAPRRPDGRPLRRNRQPRPAPLGLRLREWSVDPMRRLQMAVAALVLLVLLGTLYYHRMERMGWIDALYMTVITVATVGYGETQPLSQGGRLFTIGLILVGVATGAWAATSAIEVMLGQTFWLTMQRRKMRQTLDGMRDHFIVCGYGRLGNRIARDLTARGEAFVVIELHEEAEQEFLTAEIPYLIGDATLDASLQQAGVDRARGLVAAMDSDANNVLAVLTARGLNRDLLIVSRANSERSEGKLLRAGANRVVTPEDIGGHRLALALLRPAVDDLFEQLFSFGAELQVDVGQILVREHSPFAGQTVDACDLRRGGSVSILAIRQRDGRFLMNPDAARTIGAGETLIVIGPADAVYQLEATYGE